MALSQQVICRLTVPTPTNSLTIHPVRHERAHHVDRLPSRWRNLLRGNAPSDVAREQCVSYPPSVEDPGTGALNLHPHLRRQTSPSLGIMWVVMLWSRVEFSHVAPVAVTVTATPSGSSGIELEHIEQAVDPSRCATNVPQAHC
jgi:hypothetical protein